VLLAVTPAYPTLFSKQCLLNKPGKVMLHMANRAQVGGFALPKVMTLVPIVLFADDQLIMSMAAIGLQQQLAIN